MYYVNKPQVNMAKDDSSLVLFVVFFSIRLVEERQEHMWTCARVSEYKVRSFRLRLACILSKILNIRKNNVFSLSVLQNLTYAYKSVTTIDNLNSYKPFEMIKYKIYTMVVLILWSNIMLNKIPKHVYVIYILSVFESY